MTTLTDTDRTAADVAWDLEPLVDGRGVAGVDEQLDEADRLAVAIEQWRDQIGELDAEGLAAIMQQLGRVGELLGRAGSYAGLRFSVDTTDPENGALLQRVEERSTAINTRILFFELEWAAVPDDRVDELLADERLAFCAHHLASARRYRPHLLTEPEERILAGEVGHGPGRVEPPVQRAHAPRSRSSSTGATVGLEQGLSRLTDPDRERRARRGRGGHRRPRARAPHPRVRVQHAARRQVDRRPPAGLPRLARRA